MLNKQFWVRLGFAAVAVFSITMAGCFSNPVDPLTGGGSGDSGGSVPMNTSDVTTSSVTASYSQANSQGIYISMRDQNGDALNAAYFNSASFAVTYNGTLIPGGSISVVTAGGSGQSISSSLVLDYSGSMGAQDITDMENAAVTFVNNMQAADRGQIIKFGYYTDIYIEQHYTADKSSLINAITGPTAASGSTALHDSIYLGVTHTAQESGQKAVIAFTDGGENDSVLYPYSNRSQLISAIQTTGVPVYTVGLGLSAGSSDELALQDISSQTNGLYYRAPTSAELANIYSRIAQIFNNTMIISWPSFVYRAGDTITITITYSCSTGTYSSTINIVLS